MDSSYISYALQDLTDEEVKRFASQYSGVNMLEVIDAPDDRTPCLTEVAEGRFVVSWYGVGINPGTMLTEDSVLDYALVEFLFAVGAPIFNDIGEELKWAEEQGFQTVAVPPQA